MTYFSATFLANGASSPIVIDNIERNIAFTVAAPFDGRVAG